MSPGGTLHGLSCEEVREALPLLALDVLDVDERDALEDHLATCPACAEEAAAYGEVAAALALALPQSDPSSALKDRVLRAAMRPRALPLSEDGRRAPTPLRGLRRWGMNLSSLVAALALLVAAGSTFWALSLRAEVQAQQARIQTLSVRAENYQRVAAVLQAADTQIRVLQGTDTAPSAFGRVYIDPESSEGMLMVRNLPPLPQGQVYQLWVNGADGRRQSAGVLTWTDRQGNGYTLIKCPETLARWQSFGVTLEPSGGSPAPTGPRFLGGTI